MKTSLLRPDSGSPLNDTTARETRPVAGLAAAALEARDLQALAWLLEGMVHYLHACEPAEEARIVADWRERFRAVAQAWECKAPNAAALAQAFVDELARYRTHPVFLLMGFHGAIMFEGDEYGFFEFDSPQMAKDKIVQILELALKNGVPVNLEFEVSSLKLLVQRYPELLSLLRQAVQAGLAEIVNSTYSHPYAYMIGPESNLRQFEYGAEVYEELLGERPSVYACSEFAIHPQTPQITRHFNIVNVGLRSRLQGFGPTAPYPVILWRGLDGSCVHALAHQTNCYSGEYYASAFYKEIFSLLIQARSGSPREYAVYACLVDHTVEMEDKVEEAFRVSRWGDILGRHMTYTGLFEDGVEPYGVFSFPYDQFETTRMPCERYGGLGHRLQVALAGLERRVLQVEGLLARAMLAGAEAADSRRALREIWRSLLLCQNHDSQAVPYYRMGQYHRERLHMNLEVFPGYIDPIPTDEPTVGERTMTFIAAAEGALAQLEAETLGRMGFARQEGGPLVLEFNPNSFAVEGCAPGLNVHAAASVAPRAAAAWQFTLSEGALVIDDGQGLTLKLRAYEESQDFVPLQAANETVGSYVSPVGLTLQVIPQGDRLVLRCRTTVDGVMLNFSGFESGSEFWSNYPMGAEPTHKRNFSTSDFAWVRGAFVLLSEGNHYYLADLEQTRLVNYLYDQGEYELTLVPDRGMTLEAVGRLLTAWQVPPIRYAVAAEPCCAASAVAFESDSIHVQALIPHAAGKLLLRAMNYSAQPATARVFLPKGWMLGARVNAYGEPSGRQPEGNLIHLGPWAFGTFEVIARP